MSTIIEAMDEQGLSKPVAIDQRHRALVTTDPQQKHISEGSHYYLKTWVEVPKATTLTFMFITPPWPLRVHAFANLVASRELIACIHYDVEYSDPGVKIPHFNNNHNADNPKHNGIFDAGMQTLAEPTITDTGVECWKSKFGGDMRSANVSIHYEIQPKVNNNYLWTVTNESETKNTDLDIDFWWYECIHKTSTMGH